MDIYMIYNNVVALVHCGCWANTHTYTHIFIGTCGCLQTSDSYQPKDPGKLPAEHDRTDTAKGYPVRRQ